MPKNNKTEVETRDLTLEESHSILVKHIAGKEKLLQFKNHRKYTKLSNTFRFTVSIISLDFLITLMEDENIANVYFNPAIPPPGTGMDGVSLRYKIYVEYYKKEV